MNRLLIILLTISTFAFLSYQIPSNANSENHSPQYADSLVNTRDNDVDAENYKSAYEKTIIITDLYIQEKQWNLAIRNLYLAIVYSEYIDYDLKKPLVLKAFSIINQYPLKDDNSYQAAIFQHYGEYLVEQNKYDSASYYLEIAVKSFTEVNWLEYKMNAQIVLAKIDYLQGKYQQSVKRLLQIENEAKQLKEDNYILDMTYNMLGATYFEQLDLENAINATQKAVSLIEAIENLTTDDYFYLAGIHQNLGVYYQTMQDNKRSKLHFGTSIDYYQKLSIPQQEYIDVLNNYSLSLSQSNELKTAISQLKYNLATHRKYNSQQDNYLNIDSDINRLLSDAYQNSNALDSSFYFIEQAIYSAFQLKDNNKIASLNIKKAQLLYLNNNLNQAKKLILTSISNIDTTNSYYARFHFHLAYNTLGNIYQRQAKHDAAFQYFQKALKNNTPDIFDNNIQKIKHTYRIDHLVETLENIANTYKKINTPESLKAAYQHYQVALRWGEKMRQDFVFESSKITLNENNSRVHQNALITVQRLYELTQEEKYINEAFALVEKQKSNLLLETLIDEQGLNTLGVPKELLEREVFLKNRLAYYQQKIIETNNKKEPKAMYQSYFDNYQLAFANLKDTLSSTYQKYFDLEYKNAIADIKVVQNQLLDNQSAFIEFKIVDSTCFVFIVENDKKQLFNIPYGEKERQELKVLLSKIATRDFIKEGKNACANFQTASHQVYQSVFARVITQLPLDVKYLTIAGDAQLNFLPFEILLKSSDNNNTESFRELPYLIKDYAFHYGYSATLLYQNKKTYQSLRTNQQLLAFAPSYQKKENTPIASRGKLTELKSNLSALKGAAKEVKNISKSFDGHFDCTTNATETAFKSKMNKYGLLHLAMHGKPDKNKSNLAYLAFANQPTDSLNDNKLYHYEIANLKTSAQLAVLSACETGIGKNVEGEGIMSLGRSFMYAGIPSVVMSLWKIEDNATSELLPLFYKNLAKGENKNISLQQAKLEYLNNSSELKAHPFYWASMISLGHHEPLKPGHSMTITHWLLTVLGIISIIGLILTKRFFSTSRASKV
jgi:CHAT domain-containing protein